MFAQSLTARVLGVSGTHVVEGGNQLLKVVLSLPQAYRCVCKHRHAHTCTGTHTQVQSKSLKIEPLVTNRGSQHL